MPQRNPIRFGIRFLPALVLALPLLATNPAAAQLGYTNVNRFFAGRDAVLIVHGVLAGQRVLAIDDAVITPEPDGEGDRARVLLHTVASPGASAELAFQVVVPRLKPGLSYVTVVGEDGGGWRTEYLDATIYPDPPLELTFDREVLLSTEKLRMNARFRGSGGNLPGTFEIAGGQIRVPLSIGCVRCPIPFPVFDYDLSAELGPFPPGRWTVEVYGDDALGENRYGVPLHREEITVLPDPATVRGGRFVIEIPLDPPLEGAGRLVDAPSEDAALFYFFSPANWEAMIKVLDGCALNGFYWVFGAASTDVGYTVRVHDTLGGGVREYPHPAGTPAPAITDTAAFPCAGEEGGRR